MPLSGSRRSSGPTLGNARQSGGGGVLAVCAILSIALFTVSCRTGEEGPLGTVRGAFQTITSPVRYLGATLSMPFQGLGNVVTNLTADQQTLSELKAENEQLRARNVELEEAAQSVERLQGLLELQDVNNLQSTAAHIISGAGDSWSSTVTIDKGTTSGVSVGMPVTSASGIIGQIVECGPTTSTVRLITDESSSVSAMLQTSRLQGMLDGTVGDQLRLSLIPTDGEVSVGDVVVTSGLGGVFPKGLPLGEVTSVENSPGASYLTIVVEPYAHAENNEEVLVITSLTEEQTATDDEVASANDAPQGTARTDNAASDGNADAGADTDAGEGE